MTQQPEDLWPPTPSVQPIQLGIRYLDGDIWKERDATDEEIRDYKRHYRGGRNKS